MFIDMKTCLFVKKIRRHYDGVGIKFIYKTSNIL